MFFEQFGYKGSGDNLISNEAFMPTVIIERGYFPTQQFMGILPDGLVIMSGIMPLESEKTKDVIDSMKKYTKLVWESKNV